MALGRLGRRGAVVLAVAAVVGGGGYWWSLHHKPVPMEAYAYAAVDRGAITQVVVASGQLQPVTSVSVGTQVSGTVLERLVDFNDRVKKGQVLMRLDPALLQARLRQSKAQLDSAQAALALAQSTFERNKNLVQQGFVSALTLEQNKRELLSAQANIEVAKATVDAAQTDLDNSIIRSPVNGVVIKRNVDVGQTVAASFQTPDLYQIAEDLREMRIISNVNEADVGMVKPGQAVRFTVDAFPNREFEGTVEQFRLNPSNNQGVISYPIVVTVKNTDELLKPGMTAQTRIVVASKAQALRIPTAALRFRPEDDTAKPGSKPASPANAASAASAVIVKTADPKDDGVTPAVKDGARVFKVYTKGPDGQPVAHEVTLGIANGRFTEMASGTLKPGDALITRALNTDDKKKR